MMDIVVHKLEELEAYGITKAALAAGVFDGVHRGHLTVLREMLRTAEETGAAPCVLTFSPHPRSVLEGKESPDALLPKEIKYEFLHEAGAKAIIEIPFTKEFAALSPEDFLNQLFLGGKVRAAALCVGKNWRFGRRAAGNTELLQAYAEKNHVLFSAVPERILHGETVSSSRIRRAVAAGEIEEARSLLGRRPALYGEVVHGLGFATGSLECPTANIDLTPSVLPAFGVYGVFAVFDGVPYPGVANIGLAPTVLKAAPEKPKFEVHLPGFKGDLYGKKVKVELVKFLRPEKKFASVDELRKQIVEDMHAAMRLFGAAFS